MTTQITITYPPDYDGELHIHVTEHDYAFQYTFRHAKSGDAFETLAKAAEGIVAQALRLKEQSSKIRASASTNFVLDKTVNEIILDSRRVPSGLHPLFECLIEHFGTRRVLMSLLDLIGKRKWTLESFDQTSPGKEQSERSES